MQETADTITCCILLWEARDHTAASRPRCKSVCCGLAVDDLGGSEPYFTTHHKARYMALEKSALVLHGYY